MLRTPKKKQMLTVQKALLYYHRHISIHAKYYSIEIAWSYLDKLFCNCVFHYQFALIEMVVCVGVSCWLAFGRLNQTYCYVFHLDSEWTPYEACCSWCFKCKWIQMIENSREQWKKKLIIMACTYKGNLHGAIIINYHGAIIINYFNFERFLINFELFIVFSAA